MSNTAVEKALLKKQEKRDIRQQRKLGLNNDIKPITRSAGMLVGGTLIIPMDGSP